MSNNKTHLQEAIQAIIYKSEVFKDLTERERTIAIAGFKAGAQWQQQNRVDVDLDKLKKQFDEKIIIPALNRAVELGVSVEVHTKDVWEEILSIFLPHLQQPQGDAIEFFKWMEENTDPQKPIDSMYYFYENEKYYELDELYEMFKSQPPKQKEGIND
jgi:hypothetical protein